jgi:hypothetical protein
MLINYLLYFVKYSPFLKLFQIKAVELGEIWILYVMYSSVTDEQVFKNIASSVCASCKIGVNLTDITQV